MLARILLVAAALTVLHAEVVRVRSSGRDVLIQTDEKKKDWWQTATFYQIYPKSFKDSDGDGIGDLQGIRQKLDYIQSLGVSAIWLSPIYKSPLKDGGYDISDFRDVHPQFGTLADFKELLEDAHQRGIKVILDFVPNHTSDQHVWFQLSANRVAGYEDYYIWADPKGSGAVQVVPNNWLSVFKGSAWTFHPVRQQFYYHQFLKEQPDLNFRNDRVRQEMKDVLTYWLDAMDVDGVRIDAVPHLIEDNDLSDEPKSANAANYKPTDFEYLEHTRTVNQNGSFELVYEWRSHLDEISKLDYTFRVMMTEAATDIDQVIRYYGENDTNGAHFSFNFWLEDLTDKNINADKLEGIISIWMQKLSEHGYTPNWVLGNHDNHRIATKVGVNIADGLNMLTGFLPGVQVTYAGEEIGMEDGEVDCEHGDDFHEDCSMYKRMSRDFERTPFQWDDSTTAGFSTNNETWLPVSPKKDKCNVKAQQDSERSHLKTYMNIEKLRKQFGKLSDDVYTFKIGDDNAVLDLVRYVENDVKNVGLCAYHFLFNLKNGYNSFDFTDSVKEKRYVVLATSSNGTHAVGDIIEDSHLGLDPFEAVILKTNKATALVGGILMPLAVMVHFYRLVQAF
ncbi:unnamed protein product [Acanthoscelides obtectus]|uniref:alpha-glucosidase n=1 Tax=Acanthoscelides obtectus TaxID=200917 RepID=A0A9P0LG81_ACAOB|nr:unnamed protein product [Acanthoscelides obtectus]CAK1631980.1 Maltase 1 [Acanthoscelides obtectus]